ncbi:hypothetical protein FKM82_026184 [Ascaphus truei]
MAAQTPRQREIRGFGHFSRIFPSASLLSASSDGCAEFSPPWLGLCGHGRCFPVAPGEYYCVGLRSLWMYRAPLRGTLPWLITMDIQISFLELEASVGYNMDTPLALRLTLDAMAEGSPARALHP